MAIVQASVPVAHLATTMGQPNRLQVEYSTDVLLPLPGPYLIMQIRRDFLRAVLELNDFLLFARDTKKFLAAGGRLDLHFTHALITPRTGDASGYGRSITPAAAAALGADTGLPVRETVRTPLATALAMAASPTARPREVLLARLAAPNGVFRELFDAGVVGRQAKVLSDKLLKAKGLERELEIVLEPLLAHRKQHVPQQITSVMNELAEQALDEASRRHSAFPSQEIASLRRDARDRLVRWMVAYHVGARPPVAPPFRDDRPGPLGFVPSFFVREWAYSRKERSTLEFGTPDLRGPVAAEPVTPQGSYTRELYTASRTEAITQRRELERSMSQEEERFGSASLRRALDKVYYSGAGALDQLTSQASNSLLREDRRSAVLSLVRQWSEERELLQREAMRSTTSTTSTWEAPGIDPKLAATHHRLNVVVPVDVAVDMYDVGLTWAPRIFNPFFELRQAIRDVYDQAYTEHVQRYYVPEPTRPAIVWDTYTAVTDILMEGEEQVTARFEITLAPSDREQRADLDNARVTWNQDESFWNDDPDHFVAVLQDLNFSGGRITGKVRLETDDGGADFQGTAHIEVPILRFAQETVNALAQYELDLQDAELRRDALAAQARQYARVKQREFIERHESRDDIRKIVFEALIRSVCTSAMSAHHSYFKEIIARTIDWTGSKIEFESAPLNALAFPDFPPDHFTNSLAVRFFLPIVKVAEETLFDALEACGSFQVRASVQHARDMIDAERTRLANDGPDRLDQFSTEMVIGEHIEAVMSHHDMAS
jgi:hypothetical protein